MFWKASLFAAATLAALLAAGCRDRDGLDALEELPPESTSWEEGSLPYYLQDAVGSRVWVTGRQPIPVNGIGLVVGLNDTGTTVLAPGLRDRMLKELNRHDVLRPEELLASPDTAVVSLSGYVPPGSLPGDRFDLVVVPAAGTETTSLVGGVLLEADMTRVAAARTGPARGAVLAYGAGELFVPPFRVGGRVSRESLGGLPIGEAASSGDEGGGPASNPRIAWVLGGGRCRHPRRFQLNLMEPSERTAQQLVRHINARFDGAASGNVNPGIIDLQVPPEFSHDKQRFLDIVRTIYLIERPERRERRLRRLLEDFRAGEGNLPLVTAAIEAFGRMGIPRLERLMASEDPAVRFRAACVLAHLDRTNVLSVLEKFVRDDASPFQREAVQALGELKDGAGAAVIYEALGAESPMVRVCAYETLLRVASGMLNVREIPKRMELGVVPTSAKPFIFISRSLKARVVVFGDVRVRPPLLVDTPRLLATVREGENRAYLVSKQYGADNKITTGLEVEKIIRVLAAPPGVDSDHPKPKGLDLSYSDVVAFLEQAFQAGAIDAPLVFETLEMTAPVTGTLSEPAATESDIVIPKS